MCFTGNIICYTDFVNEKTENQKIGALGEDIAESFLVKHGYSIVERNYLKKVGEIDIVCKKAGKFYFVEVKTVSREIVSHETKDDYRPEDNLHAQKIVRLGRAIDIYLEERGVECDWEIIGVMILLDEKQKKAKVTLLENFAW